MRLNSKSWHQRSFKNRHLMLLDISQTSSNISFFCLKGSSKGPPRSAGTSVLEDLQATTNRQTDGQTEDSQ
ncbi:mCG1028900 [Mus musculus]|nr:mCG1028900 [Mus musculus]